MEDKKPSVITKMVSLLLSLRNSKRFRNSVPEMETKTKYIFLINHKISDVSLSVCQTVIRKKKFNLSLFFVPPLGCATEF